MSNRKNESANANNVVQFPSGNPQPGQHASKREQEKQKNKKARKIIMRFVTTVLTLVLVLAAIVLVVFRDQLNVDSVKRYLTYQNLEKSDDGQAEQIFYENSSSNVLAQLDNSLLVCSETNLQLFSQSGTQYVSEAVSFTTPAVYTSGSYGVAYDLGGTEYYVFAGKAVSYHGTAGGELLCARVNDNGYLTTVSQDTGYKGTVTVYDAGGEPLVKENISSAYVIDAQVNDAGRTLALVTISESGGAFLSTVCFYSVSSGEELASYELTDQVELELKWSGDSLWVQTDSGVATLSAEQGIEGQWQDTDAYLHGYASGGSDYQAMVFTNYENGTRGKLVLINASGQKIAEQSISEEVISLSANQGYIAVLYTSRLEIYTDELELYATLDETSGARQVLMRSDGSAFLTGAESAAIYVP